MGLAEYVDLASRGRFQWSPHHLVIVRAFEALLAGRSNRLMLVLPPRHSKALALGTPVPTPTGWTTMGELTPGDLVFGADGRPTAVVAKSEVFRDRPVFSVSTRDAAPIIADADHLWMARLRYALADAVVTTAQMADSCQQTGRAARIALPGPLELPEAALPIDPYLLGLWLGDGSSYDARVTIGAEDYEHLSGQLAARGITIHPVPSSPLEYWVEGLQRPLRAAGLLGKGLKRIPAEYLRASVGQRLELLRGLMDSDGNVSSAGQCFYSGNSLTLVGGVQELVRSLGAKASIGVCRATLYGKDCGPYYRCSFYLPGSATITRKVSRTRSPVGFGAHHYVKATPAGRADTVCIQVAAPDGLFLAGEAMVPTHNSELASVYGPAWWRGMHPDDYVMVASHTADLAYGFSQRVRNQVATEEWPWPDVKLRPGVATVKEWHLAAPWLGRYMATSVGGSPAGRGGHLIVIDDAVASRQAAYSETVRNVAWEWYASDIYTRRQPGARILVIGTRWHDDDLQGRLLHRMMDGSGEHWDVVHMPAFCREEPEPWALIPGTPRWRELFTAEDDAAFGVREGWHDPLGREVGQALWPTWYDEAALEQTRRTMGDQAFDALYQGSPRAGGGAFYQEDMFAERYRTIDDLTLTRVILSTDSAFKEGTNTSYSVIAVWGVAQYLGQEWYALLDVWRNRVGFPALQAAAYAMWDKWCEEAPRHAKGGSLVPLMVIEDKASGQSLLQQLAVPRPGKGQVLCFPYKPATGSTKESRTDAVLPVFRAGRVLLPEQAEWLGPWMAEHLGFNTYATNDQVDTTSQALDVLYNKRHAPSASVGTNVPGYADPQAARNMAERLDSAYNARRGKLFG